MLHLYTQYLVKYPYLTRMVTSGLILSTADLISQELFNNKQQKDYKRIAVNFSAGVIAAPWLFIWFSKVQPLILQQMFKKPLSPIYDSKLKKIDFPRLGIKIASDYFVCFPIMQFLYHITFNSLYNKSFESIKQAFNTKVSFSLQNYHQAWPLASCMIHLFVPAYFKAIFANISGTTWNNYVNYILKE